MSDLLSVEEFFQTVIRRWEGGWQAYPNDRGNWYRGALLGTMWGVTPVVLAEHRKLTPEQVTIEVMHSVTVAEAAAIGVAKFYVGPGFHRLPWSRTTAFYVDVCWGSGPRTAICELQRHLGVPPDGLIGPDTAAAMSAYLERVGDEHALEEAIQRRLAWIDRLIRQHPDLAKFRSGWRNRTKWHRNGVQRLVEGNAVRVATTPAGTPKTPLQPPLPGGKPHIPVATIRPATWAGRLLAWLRYLLTRKG